MKKRWTIPSKRHHAAANAIFCDAARDSCSKSQNETAIVGTTRLSPDTSRRPSASSTRIRNFRELTTSVLWEVMGCHFGDTRFTRWEARRSWRSSLHDTSARMTSPRPAPSGEEIQSLLRSTRCFDSTPPYQALPLDIHGVGSRRIALSYLFCEIKNPFIGFITVSCRKVSTGRRQRTLLRCRKRFMYHITKSDGHRRHGMEVIRYVKAIQHLVDTSDEL